MSLVGVIFFPVNLSVDGVYSRSFCHAQGVLYAFLSMTTFFILGLITFDRYTLLILNRPLNRRWATLIYVIAGLCFITTGLLPTLTENTVGIDTVKSFGLACYQDGGLGVLGHDFIVAFNDSVFLAIFFGMVWMYYRIFSHLQNVFKNAVIENSERAQFNREVENKILVQFIIITAFFLVCWVVLAFTWFVAPFGWRLQGIHMEGLIGFTCHLNSSSNPLIYGTMNKHLRTAMGKRMPQWVHNLWKPIKKYYNRRKVHAAKELASTKQGQSSGDNNTTGFSSNKSGQSSGTLGTGTSSAGSSSIRNSSVGGSHNSSIHSSRASEIGFHDSELISLSAASSTRESALESAIESTVESSAEMYTEVEMTESVFEGIDDAAA